MLALAVSGPARGASAPGVSDWVVGPHARVRLIDAGPLPGGGRLAGIQIALEPTYLTYWRSPGEAGVPPMVSTDGSTNVAALDLQFPAPARYDEGGAAAFGYKDEVVFPATVTPVDPGQPVGLRVALSFALCATLCLPATATVGLTLAGNGNGPEADLVRTALARVPVRRAIDETGPLAITTIAAGLRPDLVMVTAKVADGTHPTLFVEAPEPWYFDADEGTPTTAGAFLFQVRALSGPAVPTRVAVRFTLVAQAGAIEVQADLDAAAPKP